MPAAALVTDLIFSTKIASTAQAVGATIKIVRTLEKLQDRLSAGDSPILVDLNAEGMDAIEAIRRCKAALHQPRTIAYVSHVQADLIEHARQAGADEIMARSAFVNKLASILERTKPRVDANEHE